MGGIAERTSQTISFEFLNTLIKIHLPRIPHHNGHFLRKLQICLYIYTQQRIFHAEIQYLHFPSSKTSIRTPTFERGLEFGEMVRSSYHSVDFLYFCRGREGFYERCTERS